MSRTTGTPGVSRRDVGAAVFGGLSAPLVLQQLLDTRSGTKLPIGAVEDYRALRRLQGGDYAFVLVRRYDAALDDFGAAGVFYWDAADGSSDDDGTILAPQGGGAGRWRRVHAGPLDARWFGARGDGSFDDTEKIRNADEAASRGLLISAGSYRIEGALSIANETSFASGGMLSIQESGAVVFQQRLGAPRSRIFSGPGNLSLTRPQTVYPEWWGGGLDAVPAAVRLSAPGSAIELAGKYTTDMVVFRPAVDKGKALVGIAAPHSRDASAAEENEGAALYLHPSEGNPTAIVYFEGEADSPRCGIRLDRLKLNGAGRDVYGVHITGCRDVWIGSLYVNNCGRQGLRVDNGALPSGTSVNNVSAGDVEIWGCSEGTYLGNLADSSFDRLVGHHCVGDGIKLNGGNLRAHQVHAYLNGGYGLQLAGTGQHSVGFLRANHNWLAGVRLQADRVTIDQVLAYNNGQSLGGDHDVRSGVLITAGERSSIGSILTHNLALGAGVPMAQTYGLYARGLDPASGRALNRVGRVREEDGPDGRNAMGLVHVEADSRRGLELGVEPIQRPPYGSSLTPDPTAGEVVEVLLASDLVVSDAAPEHKLDGARLTFSFAQGGAGGFAVTFDAAFLVSWTPDTAPGRANSISFVYSADADRWVQTAAATGL